MAKIKGYVDPYWHETYLMVLILNRGSMRKSELFDRVREEQKKRIVLGEKGQTHSRRNYDRWVERRKDQWVISEREGTLELTRLGKWIASSRLGTFFERDDLANLICSNCAKSGDLVFLKPLPGTAETNAKGRLFMNLQCPRCQNRISRMPISETLSEEEFVQFYNKALRELHGIIKGQPLAFQ